MILKNKKKELEIILVEDDPDDVAFILHAIKSSNMVGRVHVLHDGQDALDFLFSEGPYIDRVIEQTPKVILLDLKIPKLDGHYVLSCIKKDPRTSSIPVVVLTSSLQDEDVDQSYLLGANSYIVKPVDFQKFLVAVLSVQAYWTNVNHRT